MRRTILVVWCLALAFVASCNYDTGECYPRGQDGAGAGGGVILQGGAGGFGDAPTPKPQDAPNTADPCAAGPTSAQCVVVWKNPCSSQESGSECIPTTGEYRCEHATLDAAKKACEKTMGVGTDWGAQSCGPCQWVQGTQGKCEDKCWAEHDAGHEKCNKVKDKKKAAKCHQAVNEQLATCLSKC